MGPRAFAASGCRGTVARAVAPCRTSPTPRPPGRRLPYNSPCISCISSHGAGRRSRSRL